MKNLFLALALMLVGTFAFANNSVEKKIETKAEKIENTSNYDVLEVRVETIIIDKEVICWRSCYYQGGRLLGCTLW